MIAFQDYKHVVPVQLRFADIDRLNHLNNAKYLTFFELGRVSYFKQVLHNAIEWDKNGFILARTEIDHLTTVHLDDEVYCFTKIVKLGTKSITIKNSVVKKVKGELIECAKGIGILVAMDYVNVVSMPVPEAWRKLFEEFEN